MDKLEIEPFLIENFNNVTTEDLQEIINKYENHPSIIKIKENVRNENDFILDFEREILKLDTKKANLQGTIYKISQQKSLLNLMTSYPIT